MSANRKRPSLDTGDELDGDGRVRHQISDPTEYSPLYFSPEHAERPKRGKFSRIVTEKIYKDGKSNNILQYDVEEETTCKLKESIRLAKDAVGSTKTNETNQTADTESEQQRETNLTSEDDAAECEDDECTVDPIFGEHPYLRLEHQGTRNVDTLARKSWRKLEHLSAAYDKYPEFKTTGGKNPNQIACDVLTPFSAAVKSAIEELKDEEDKVSLIVVMSLRFIDSIVTIARGVVCK